MKGALPALVCVSSHLSPLHYTPSYHLPELVIGRGAGIREDRRDIDCCRNIFLEQAFACCQLGGRCCVWRRPYPGFVIASIRSFLMPLIRCIDHICYLLSELRLYLHYVITLENELCYKVQNMLWLINSRNYCLSLKTSNNQLWLNQKLRSILICIL